MFGKNNLSTDLSNEAELHDNSIDSRVADEKAFMMNAVWFKGRQGESRYRDYLRKMSPLIKKVGGRKLKSFVPERSLIGELDADLIFFLEYPSWQAFKQFANSPEYHKIAYIREEALDKQILIRCGRPGRSFWG